MSFMDSTLELWDNQILTVSEESRTNGDYLDMEQIIGSSDLAADAVLGHVWLNIIVGTVPTGMASGGYFQLVTSDSATFTTGSGGEQAIAAIGSADLPLFVAQLTAGARFSVGVPTRVLHRYLEVEWRVISEAAGGDFAVDAWLGMEPLSDLSIQKEPT